MSWAFGLSPIMGAGVFVILLCHVASISMFGLFWKNDTPETRARLPLAWKLVILGLFLQAVWMPIFLLVAPPLSEKYTDQVESG